MKNYKIKIENENQFNEVVELAVKMGYKKHLDKYFNAIKLLYLNKTKNIGWGENCFNFSEYQEITIDQLRTLADPESLIGRKVKGFWFNNREYDRLPYDDKMNNHIGEIGEIKKINKFIFKSVEVQFKNDWWHYPLELIHEHLIKETMKLTDITEKQVVHCATEEEAKRICKLAHDNGLKWDNGYSYLEVNYWEEYKEQTCYDFNIDAFADIKFHKQRGYEIIPSTQITEEPQPKQELNKVWAWDDDVEDAFETYLIKEFEGFKNKYLCIYEEYIKEFENKCFIETATYKNISETDPRKLDKVDILKKHIGESELYDINGTDLLSNILNAMEDYKNNNN